VCYFSGDLGDDGERKNSLASRLGTKNISGGVGAGGTH